MRDQGQAEEEQFRGTSARKKCLFGVNILLVDDSRAVSEAIRLMSVKSGARVRRADCIASAMRHLSLFRPDLLIIDLALPDGTGVDLVHSLRETIDNLPAILIISGADEEEVAAAARDVDADMYLVKPISSLATFQSAVNTALTGLSAPQVVTGDAGTPDIGSSDALRHDFENMHDLLGEAIENGERSDFKFAAKFLLGVVGTAPDPELEIAVEALDAALGDGLPVDKEATVLRRLLTNRIQESWDLAS